MPVITYTASAGSGKTYALTREYLRMLLSQSVIGNSHRQLLAITFTNKAADEMKTRIIERLDKLSTGTDENEIDEFCSFLSISPVELQNRATALRTSILHDYSHFSVATIDAFFQKIVRSFLREMGLLPGFALELDSDRLLDQAIDALWQDVATNNSVRKRLTDLINQRISAGQSWNAREQLKTIGKEIFKESFRSFGADFRAKIGDAEFLKNYELALQEIVKTFSETMREGGKKAVRIMTENGMAAGDFKYKASSFANYFNKIQRPQSDKDYIPGSRVSDALNNEEKWLTGDAAKDTVVRNIIFPQVNPVLENLLACYKEYIVAYRTARETIKNLYGMALLADLAERVIAISNEENILLISDTLYLLRELIGENDTPFVYEKAGVYYRSFLLDEFQDTSNMQWESLRPLLLNGLSEGGNVLAVGDVKQSIYRWRSGDWRILATGIHDDFAAFHSQKVVLDTNWRSKEVIIATNNELFSRLPALMQEKLNRNIAESGGLLNEQMPELSTMIVDAYTETMQKVSPAKTGSGGYVHIERITPEKEEEQSAKEKVLQRLPLLIAELQDRGYRAADIALLVRYGREGQEIADTLMHYKQTTNDTTHCFDVISQDSLFLQHAPVVRFIIAVLHSAVMDDDVINKAVAEHYIQRFLPGKKLTAGWLEKILHYPLTDALEAIIAYFGLNSDSSNWAFLQELQDVALTYADRESNSIFPFLQHWKEAGDTYTLSMTDERNALRVTTIHKSKGLQFRVVIIPFCNWTTEPKTNSLIWVKTNERPFSGPGYLPLNYTNALADTFFNADYWLERAQSAIDNLNLLYVAFTRAEEELYAFLPQSSRGKNTFSQLLPELLQTDLYTAGHQVIPPLLCEKETTSSLFLKSYDSQSYIKALRVKYANERPSDLLHAGMRDYGILMHRAFYYIDTECDIEKAVEKIIEEGFISNEATVCQTLRRLLYDALSQEGVKEWFDGSWQLITETNLLLPASVDGKLIQLRPDRVMRRGSEVVVIDYKFGTRKLAQHITQVENYISCMADMGSSRISGYCWYVSLKEIIPVN